MKLPNRLQKVRHEKGLTQVQLAELTGLKPCAISHYENGRRKPSYDNLLLLCKTLGVKIDYLVYGKG